jgi:hypothetical protein
MKFLVFMTSLFYRWYNNQKRSKEIERAERIKNKYFNNKLKIN